MIDLVPGLVFLVLLACARGKDKHFGITRSDSGFLVEVMRTTGSEREWAGAIGVRAFHHYAWLGPWWWVPR
jgi:hypothetical protein